MALSLVDMKLRVQMGHQAAQCKTGTIPWRQVFGDEAFVVRKPVFWTDVLAKREARKVSHEKLTADAVAFARQACEAQGKNYDADVMAVAQASQDIDTVKLLAELRAEVEVKEKEAKIAADPTANLPPGWNVAYVRSYQTLKPCHNGGHVTDQYRIAARRYSTRVCMSDCASWRARLRGKPCMEAHQLTSGIQSRVTGPSEANHPRCTRSFFFLAPWQMFGCVRA